MADSQKRRQVGEGIEDHWFLSELFVADVHYNRIVGIEARRFPELRISPGERLYRDGQLRQSLPAT
jgi:hypothetical protein